AGPGAKTEAAGSNGERVRPQLLEILTSGSRGTAPNRDEQDDGSDADRDAECGERRAQLVHHDAAQRDAHAREIHRKPRPATVASTGARPVSSTTAPSRSRIIRRAVTATSASCVITITVR